MGSSGWYSPSPRSGSPRRPPRGSQAPKTFATAREAGQALVAAAAGDDVPALLAIFGSRAAKLVASGDEVAGPERSREVRRDRRRSWTSRRTRSALTGRCSSSAGGLAVPVPLVEKKGKWAFSSKRGCHELLGAANRSNELDAIEICRGYVEAQQEYAEQDRDARGPRVCAEGDHSPGKRTAWLEGARRLSGRPIAEGIAAAISEGYTDRPSLSRVPFPDPQAAGARRRLGAMDYVINAR